MYRSILDPRDFCLEISIRNGIRSPYRVVVATAKASMKTLQTAEVDTGPDCDSIVVLGSWRYLNPQDLRKARMDALCHLIGDIVEGKVGRRLID
jgi:hypothetical protein